MRKWDGLSPDADGVDVAIHAHQEWGIRSFISVSITEELTYRTRAIELLGYLPKPFRHSRFQAFLAMVPKKLAAASTGRG